MRVSGRVVLAIVILMGLAVSSTITKPINPHAKHIPVDGGRKIEEVPWSGLNVTMIPAAISPGNSAVVKVDFVPNCALVKLEFGDGSSDQSLGFPYDQNGQPQPIEVTHTWATAGAYNVYVEGATACGIASGEAALRVGTVEEVQLILESKGQWSPAYSWPSIPVHMHVLPNGKVLGWDYPDAGTTYPWTWDPSDANNPRAVTPTQQNPSVLFCSGHAILPDGRLLVVGGGLGQTDDLKRLTIFDFNAGTWTTSPAIPYMQLARWYPTVTTLGSGELLITGGEDTATHVVAEPEVVTADGANLSIRRLTSAPRPFDSASPYDNWYPLMFAAPNGKVFDVGEKYNSSGYLATAGNGAWTGFSAPKLLNFGPNTQRFYASAVMYDSFNDPVNGLTAKVLLAGGGNGTGGCQPESNVTADAEVIELKATDGNSTTPSWQSAGSMNHAREYQNATLLADGTVLVSGGFGLASGDPNSIGVLAAEIWNPDPQANPRWKVVASMKHRRVYHSTAVLLPDGRVLAGGGSAAGAVNCSYKDVQIYSPPYLFKGARPVIASAPGVIGYGEKFFVGTAATNIGRVHLIRLGSVTHSFDENQRLARLTYEATAGGLNVTAPVSGNQAPPGHYMLFIVDSNGVPSVSKILRVSVASTGTPGAFTKSSPSNGATFQPTNPTLSWSASSGATEYEYCIDTSDNNVCNGTWVSAGTNTSVQLSGLTNDVKYSWQVRANKGVVTSYADGNAQSFWSLRTRRLDLNGDVNGDVFTYDFATGAWTRAITQANGTFTQTTGSWASGWTILSAKFDADDLTDYFLFNATTGNWAKMLNTGTGFTTQATGQWWPGWQRFAMNLDSDGLTDLFLYDTVTGQWFKCISTATGFTYTQGYWNAGWEITPLNLNGDALGDMFLINRSDGAWYWVLGAAGSSFQYPANSYWYPTWNLYPGDFNGDGLSDLLLHEPGTGAWYVAMNNGLNTGFTYTGGYWTTGWTPSVGDLNADGAQDLFLYAKSTGTWFELRSDLNGQFTSVGNDGWLSNWDVYPTDFNGDGRTDFLLYNPATGDWYQARNLQFGSFTSTNGTWGTSLTIVVR